MPHLDPHIDSRETILTAAARLFVEFGYRGIAMRQIAEAVGVTKAALYYHFSDKEELFVAVMERHLLELGVFLRRSEASGVSCRAQIAALVLHILGQPVEIRSLLRLASQEAIQLSEGQRTRLLQIYHEQFIGQISALMAEGMRRGEFRAMPPGVATWSLLGMLYPYFHVNPAPGNAPTPALAEQLLTLYFDGLAA